MPKFICGPCFYQNDNVGNYNKHLKTPKHIKNVKKYLKEDKNDECIKEVKKNDEVIPLKNKNGVILYEDDDDLFNQLAEECNKRQKEEEVKREQELNDNEADKLKYGKCDTLSQVNNRKSCILYDIDDLKQNIIDEKHNMKELQIYFNRTDDKVESNVSQVIKEYEYKIKLFEDELIYLDKEKNKLLKKNAKSERQDIDILRIKDDLSFYYDQISSMNKRIRLLEEQLNEDGDDIDKDVIHQKIKEQEHKSLIMCKKRNELQQELLKRTC